MIKLKVATRGSKLSLEQVVIAMRFLEQRLGERVEYEPVIVKTRGDVMQDRPLFSIGVKGVFEKEVNRAVLNGEADVAVHSMKDLPSQLEEDLEIAMVPPREVPNDSLVIGAGSPEVTGVEDVPSGLSVGTSSVRRIAFLRHYNRNVITKVVRGNVDTRIAKLNRGEVNYLLMAEAGLRRLNIPQKRVMLPLDKFPPEPGQGIIAVVAPSSSPLFDLLRRASDEVTYAMAMAERKFVELIGAGCHTPIGAVSILEGGRLAMIAAAASPDGEVMNFARASGSLGEPERIARELVENLKVP
ncbi:Porphobilinogen deaminase [Acidilobus saccharovorans 345-15]|uniref:Hydroxymethylbilane synthase n=1 Tax=Acidilobus saccharovorans (strain DSM 16705 / JCM 18335 / VKM B-2471 / 345-15) TaxID=666510 RepID=D9Q2S0_ACIS3|nr:hydroxymethylbilane synthase [Acidilobus saccharovorans]ADL19608.1 Porphobilinogen deaminase [Acidilobus saccharovorans 345-15]